MNYKELENNIRQQLGSHEVKMDTDQLVAALFNKKKKKPFPMWLLALAFAILATAGFMIIKNQIYKSDYLPQNPANYEKTPKNVNASINNYNSEKTVAANEISKTEILKNSNDAEINNSSELISNSVGSKKLNNNSYSQKRNIGNNNYGAVKNSGPNYSSGENAFLTNENLNIPENNSTFISKSNTQLKLTDYKYLKIIPSKNALLVSDDVAELSNKYPGVKCPSFKRKKSLSFSLIPEVGVFYPMTTFENNSNPNSEVLDIRKQNETTLEGLQAAIYGKISMKSKPWYLKGGLNYGRITRKMTFDGSYIKRDTTIGIISITESQTGDTLTVVKGPIITETKITRKEVRHYFHHLWSVPLVVGYQKRFEKFEIGGEAGVNINVRSNQSGYVMTAPDQFGYVKDAGLYRQKVGISYLAQVHVGLPVNEHNVFALALRANLNPNNFANAGTSLSEKYQIIGAHLMYELRF